MVFVTYPSGCKGNLLASFRHDLESFLKKVFSKKSLPNSLNSKVGGVSFRMNEMQEV